LKGVLVVRKLRLYLETTIFNYYFDTDREGHSDTVKLFSAIGAGKYEAYTSEYTEIELRKSREPKRRAMLGLIEEYRIMSFEAEDEAYRLADLYVRSGIIPERFRFDATHIAVASIHGLDCVLSYNFEHINRARTKAMTEQINYEEGYKGVVICTAKEVLGDERESG
jgi:predicted nucleic acid-binding protein